MNLNSSSNQRDCFYKPNSLEWKQLTVCLDEGFVNLPANDFSPNDCVTVLVAIGQDMKAHWGNWENELAYCLIFKMLSLSLSLLMVFGLKICSQLTHPDFQKVPVKTVKA